MLELNKIYQGDYLEVIQDIDSGSIDCIVTDPPYQLSSPNTKNVTKGFMGKSWDICPSIEIWQESLRVLKPGAFAFVMCIPRQDCLARMICRLEDAGFNISFSSVLHTFASGFPKAQNLSKAADKRRGVKREVIGIDKSAAAKANKNKFNQCTAITPGNIGVNTREFSAHRGEITEAVTEQAKALDGAYGGFQPKPAVEVIIVAMKPLEEKTYVAQALKNGHGCTWLDDARIPILSSDNLIGLKEPYKHITTPGGIFKPGENGTNSHYNIKGRFPANVLCEDDVLNDGTISKPTERPNLVNKIYPAQQPINFYGKETKMFGYPDTGSFSRYFSLDAWFAKRIKQLPKEAQKTFPFMIIPKASKSEKNRGLEKGLYVCECFILYDEKCKEENIIHEEKLVKLQGDMGTLHLKDIEEYGTRISIDSEWSTLLFGKPIMELFQKDIASIIKIRTRSTIISQILKWLTSLLTKEYIQDVKLLMETGGNLASTVEDCNTLIITINEKLASRLIAKDVVLKLQFKISIKEEKERNTHVSVKPYKLMSWLITLASREGDIVLDPFCGSGTTAIAAKMLGRQYIGIEREEDYCEIARKRIAAIPQRLDGYGML